VTEFEFDPPTDFTCTPVPRFYCKGCGGVQDYPDGLHFLRFSAEWEIFDADHIGCGTVRAKE